VAGVQEAWTAYQEALEADPLLVKSLTASVILGAGDLAGQALEAAQKEGEESSIDFARTARFAIFGLVLQAPWNHFYYLMLDGAIPPTEEPWTATTGIKVVIDQFVQAPIFTVLIFAFLGFLEGKSAAAIKQQLDDDYVDTMYANCKSLKRPNFLFHVATTHMTHLRSTTRETLAACYGSKYCLCPSDFARTVSERHILLLVDFLVCQVEQGRLGRSRGLNYHATRIYLPLGAIGSCTSTAGWWITTVEGNKRPCQE
jgi:hypothetical protein